jgi:hypothetical protein
MIPLKSDVDGRKIKFVLRLPVFMYFCYRKIDKLYDKKD